MQQRIRITATQDDAGQRADVFFAAQTGSTRSHIAKLIKDGYVLCGGEPIKAKHIIKDGSEYTIDIPEPIEIDLQPWETVLDIVYEDEHLAVINKPRGMVVHPAPGNENHTMVNALMHSLNSLSGINGELRPGIVHRLDKNTTGLIVVAKNDDAHTALAAAIKDRLVKREYLALVHGNFAEDEGSVDAPIGRSGGDRKLMAVVQGGREARTNWRVERRFGDATLLRCALDTGRTHQIRVHMKYIKHPVLGDPEYGPAKDRAKAKGQLLHSARLCFTHPATGAAMQFDADLPEDFAKALRRLEETSISANTR